MRKAGKNMRKGTLISIIIALVAVAGALLGLVAYMRSRRCLECGDVEEDYIPDADADGEYDMDYYVDGNPISDDSAPLPKAPAEDTAGDDITD